MARNLLPVLLMVVMAASPGVAQDPVGHTEEGHDHLANHLALFVGATTPFEETDETSFTVGADYVRRLSELWGIGPLVDFTFGDFKRTALAGAGLFFYPVGGLRLLGAPAVELVEKDQPTSEGVTTKHDGHFTLRLGAAYEFHVGSYSIAPTLNIDLIGETEENAVYGIAVGLRF